MEMTPELPTAPPMPEKPTEPIRVAEERPKEGCISTTAGIALIVIG